MNEIQIRECHLSDLESMRYLQPSGWDDITLYFRFYCLHTFCHPVVVVQNGEIIGVATGIVNGATGWLAHIIVSENHRQQGIGYRLTQHIMNYLYQQGCKTQLLIATEMGEPVYRKCGFKTVSQYIFFRGPQLQMDDQFPDIRALEPADLPDILELDQLITGEHRQNMIANFLSNGWVYSVNGVIKGYFLPEFGEGMIIASDVETGIALLKFKLVQGAGKAVLPVENRKGIQLLETVGYHRFNIAPRMVLGEDVRWRPDLIFSRAGGFYG